MYDHNAPMNARGIIIVAPRSPGIANAGVNFKLQISNDANNWETIMETGKVYPNDSNMFVSIAWFDCFDKKARYWRLKFYDDNYPGGTINCITLGRVYFIS